MFLQSRIPAGNARMGRRNAAEWTQALILLELCLMRQSTDGFQSLLGAVTMYHFHPVARLAQRLADIFRDHHRAMLAPGAAEGNRQVAFPFTDVMRQEVDQ